jgi:hypothetical protein
MGSGNLTWPTDRALSEPDGTGRFVELNEPKELNEPSGIQ